MTLFACVTIETHAALDPLLEAFTPRVTVSTTAAQTIAELDLGRARMSDALQLAAQIGDTIRNALGRIPALGFARTRCVARVAAALPCAAVVVPPGREAAFLAPLPIDLLPIDTAIAHRLQLFGLHTIGAVAALPRAALQAQFGPHGRLLHDLAHGNDATPIARVPPAPQLAVRRRFDGPVTQRTALEMTLPAMAAHLAARLAAAGRAAQEVTLTLTFDDGADWSALRVLAEPASSPAALTAALRGLFAQADCHAGVEMLRAAITAMRPTAVAQLELFPSAHHQAHQLDAALRRLAARYAGSFMRATVHDAQAVLPEQRVRIAPLDL